MGNITESYGYGPRNGNSAVGENAYFDWGRYAVAGFRLMTASEWYYLIYSRDDAANLRGACTLFGHKGIMFLPDGWSWDPEKLPDAITNAIANYNVANPDDVFVWTAASGTLGKQSYSANKILDTTTGHALWTLLEDAGVVFLPSTGYRYAGTSSDPTYTSSSYATVVNYNGGLHYWTSTASGANGWYLFYFREGDGFDTPKSITAKYYGRAVRLVEDVVE